MPYFFIFLHIVHCSLFNNTKTREKSNWIMMAYNNCFVFSYTYVEIIICPMDKIVISFCLTDLKCKNQNLKMFPHNIENKMTLW